MKLLSILAVLFLGCTPASPPTVYVEKEVPIPIEQPQPEPEPETVYTCAQALEYPGVYAARLVDEELENYLNLVDYICSIEEFADYNEFIYPNPGSCNLGLISVDQIRFWADFCNIHYPSEPEICLEQTAYGSIMTTTQELYHFCVGE